MADSEPGIGKKILSFFIKENEGPARQGSNTSAPLESQKPAASAKVSNVAKANLPGPDYFEYKQALQNMEGLGLGEEKLFQAAWASFKAMGGVKDPTILKTSADQYLAILDKDRSSFLKDVEKAINDRVGSLQNEQKKLEESNAAFSQQIADLQKKIDENKNRLGQISGEVTEQSAKINANKDSFEITYRSFVEQISSDLTKINKHLTN
jgi:DNA-binding transcriptional MerR regulator